MKHTLAQSAAKIPTDYKKIAFGLILAVIAVMPEETAEILLDLLHLGYEGISFVLEETIQHVFHVDKNFSQSVVFYLWLSTALIGLYCLWRTLPALCRKLKDHLFAVWLHYRAILADYWSSLTLVRKIGFIALYATGLYLLFFIFS